jgi:hypothetical protein
MVSRRGIGRRRPEGRQVQAFRAFFMVLVALALLSGIAGGLLRLGIALPASADATWPGAAALHHGALMIVGFLGTVIGIERAVAVKRRAAFTAPLLSAASAVALLAGAPAAGAWLGALAAAVFAGVGVAVVRRQAAAHTWLLLAGAVSWLAGSALHALGIGLGAVVPLWFSFLVLTIAAERLEMARLMRQRPSAQAALLAVLGLMLGGAAGSALWPGPSGVAYGASLALLAAWLGAFDIARRTVRAEGLSRYMAVCLLAGYAWLAVAGVAWAATSLGWPWRDAALHALGLGFVFSMMLAHAPVILPAVARVKLAFGAVFYVPLVLLHGSLALRLAGGAADPAWRAAGGAWNAAAIAAFAATVAGAAVAWRVSHGRARRPRAGH